MALAAGARLGSYEILSILGVGGMGEVYRAHDTKLNRDVAIKVLPALFAGDLDRVARFKREAQVLAALNHPHIAHIHGFEDADGIHALILELVDGPTLAEHLDGQRAEGTHSAQGNARSLPVAEALQIARQIAEALQAAHEQGIVHRDLKPANIKVRDDGTVKVLDFGLAKVLEAGSAGEAGRGAETHRAGGLVELSQSPTFTSPAMLTDVGVILGTAAYMSPEQAKGRPADKRSDVWAFGAVLYEMLTGKGPFTGEDLSTTLAAVIMKDPDWTALPPTVPPAIRTLVHRCLEKDRTRRIADISTALFVIDEPAGLSPAGAITAPLTGPQPAGWRRALPWVVASALAVGLVLVLVSWVPWRKASPPALLRVSAELGAAASLVIAPSGGGAPAGTAAVVSPDGSQLAFVAQPLGSAPRLYVRRLNQLTATPLAGTENAAGPFFSPDGQSLGFFSGGKLKKIAVGGGAPVALADAPSARGGSWAEDGTIVFTPTSNNIGLWRVPAAGGTAERLTTPATEEFTHRWPQVLPGGRAVLYTVATAVGNFTAAWLAVQPLPAGTPQIVQRGGSYGRYLSSGHLTWVHDGTLFAAPFDLTTLAVTGPAVPVVPGVVSSATSGIAQMEVSHTGTLVYLPGGETALAAPLEWLTRDGKTMPLRATPASWGGVQIAPDGNRLAFSLTGANMDVWTYDAARDAPSPLTLDPGLDRNPVWTPDGQRLVYASSRSSGGVTNLYWQRADGGGGATRLTTSPNVQNPGSWDPRGRFLAFQEDRPQTGTDLMILPVEGDEASGWKPGTATVFLSTSFSEQQPRFSPDGRWLAYESNESGSAEIYVRPFPIRDGKWPISTGGGTNAVWSRKRRELLYLAPDGRIMVVPYTVAGDAFQAEKPRVWSETPIQRRPFTPSFDLHPDGDRVAMAPVTTATASPTHVTLIFNFFDELRRLAPVAAR